MELFWQREMQRKWHFWVAASRSFHNPTYFFVTNGIYTKISQNFQQI
jgi:hypothetical protein